MVTRPQFAKEIRAKPVIAGLSADKAGINYGHILLDAGSV